MRFHRKCQDGSKSGDETWSSGEGTSRPGTGTGNPFTDDDNDDNEYVLLARFCYELKAPILGLSLRVSQQQSLR